jgi:hypothetical protein
MTIPAQFTHVKILTGLDGWNPISGEGTPLSVISDEARDNANIFLM